MTHALRLAGLCACLTFFAASAYAQKKPVSCGADVLLSVVAHPTNAEGTTSGLYSDRTDPTSGQPTPYTSGVDNVDARLQVDNCYLDFVMNLNFTSRKLLTSTAHYGVETVSFVNFDGVANVPVTPDASDAGVVPLATFCSGVPNNYGGCGIDAGRELLRAPGRRARLQRGRRYLAVVQQGDTVFPRELEEKPVSCWRRPATLPVVLDSCVPPQRHHLDPGPGAGQYLPTGIPIRIPALGRPMPSPARWRPRRRARSSTSASTCSRSG